jgi:hypothetical protein
MTNDEKEAHPMTQYDALFTNARWWITADGDLIGGYAANALRSYVFPLYTPGGVLVLQEAPPDHPHHQGIHVGLSIDGYDLWNAGSGDRERHAQRMSIPLGEIKPEIAADGVRIAHSVVWTTVDGQALLREERQIQFSRTDEFTRVRWRSTFHAAARAVHIDQTKEAGIALRVPPHWETIFGGQIRNAHGDVGEAACFDRSSPWLNIQGSAGNGHKAGVVFAPAPDSEPCPWFTRDYGEHLYNPSRHHAIPLDAGASFTWAVSVVAYDGDWSVDQIESAMR